MNSSSHEQAPSTELTGGAGFTFEDTVVAYYLAALLRADHAAGLDGFVTGVAVQQKGHGHLMDDLVVKFDHAGERRTLGLQIKRPLTISAAESNEDFRGIVASAIATQRDTKFHSGFDAVGFVAENVAVASFQTLGRLIQWAKASPDARHFGERFESGGAAAAAERSMKAELAPLIGAASPDDEIRFYRHFAALHMNGLSDGGPLRAAVLNHLREATTGEEGQDALLFGRLCQIAREGAATATKWTRASLLVQLRGSVQLRGIPRFKDDVARIDAFSREGLSDVAETVDDFHVPRDALHNQIKQQLEKHRVVSIGGLPGCGKSAVLKRFTSGAAERGPILFLKTDRLQGTGWTTFATALGLKHHDPSDLLAEIGATGTPILFIDGIDRIRPDQQGVVTDLIRAIESDPGLKNWKVLASSRDQGLEAFRAWFPLSFYASGGIGDIQVRQFSNEEAELLAKSKPNLRKLLFGSPAVQAIARRPFFVAVLARSIPDDSAPQTEVDLISAWWARAGHDAIAVTISQRKRALIDISEKGVRNLGKGVPVRDLKEATVEQIAALKADHIIREERGGSLLSFTHDIFFEWSFFQLLNDLGDNWTSALEDAGEPPLLGRVVGLLAQSALTESGRWTAGYNQLSQGNLRAQWRREWLTAPPFTQAFTSALEEFTALMRANDFALCEKLLVWFQAQHTIPSPVVLQGATNVVEGIDWLRIADMLGWPSDFGSWGRLIDWLIASAPALPVRLIPSALEVLGVWQNALSDLGNPRSKDILQLCSTWLIRLEDDLYSEAYRSDGKWKDLSSEACSSLATSLRSTILRAARSYPEFAIALMGRAVANERMRDKAYDDLMGFTPVLADVAPDAVIQVAEAKLMEELPQDTFDRVRREEQDRIARLNELRAKPEDQLTAHERRVLDSPPIWFGRDDIRYEQIGIEEHNSYYSPTSALHEPFASLLAKSPDAGLRLIRDLSNHATTGWRQNVSLRREGTPLPVVLDFPWGRQEFWGGWRVYSWGQGELGPQPLECAYLALMYWACNEIEKGRSASEVIRLILEGSQCYASLGLCLCLALEAREVSAATLPIVACQRLWQHDLQRLVQEPHKNLDLLGFGVLSRLTGDKAKAKEYLDQRNFRKREVRELAMLFALSPDDDLRERFKALLAAFPRELPYELEEQRSNPETNADLIKHAERWSGLGDRENYRKTEHQDYVAIQYEPPTPLTAEDQERLAESSKSLSNAGVLSWAMKSLNEGKPADGWKMSDAIAFAKKNDSKSIFEERADTGEHYVQSAIAAIASCVIHDEAGEAADRDWAWDVMARVETMREPAGFHGSKIPWHPMLALVVALFHSRRANPPRADARERLLKLTSFPLDDVQHMAFQALFSDPDERVQWIAARLAFDLSLYWRPVISDTWTNPNPSFNSQFASKIFSMFPIEAWCRSEKYRPKIQDLLAKFAAWTGERLVPSWHDRRSRRDPDTFMYEWSHTVGAMIARAAPFLELEWVREHLLRPFLVEDEEVLRVLAEFASNMVTRHVLDATEVPSNTLTLLEDCVARILRDSTFRPSSYRAGEVNGYDMPKLIDALLFVNVESASGAARFANGDWSSISIVMPLVTQLVTSIGWSTYVMGKFLTLCERAGGAYPLDDFIKQSSAVLNSIANAKGAWVGTSLPARMAGIVQRLADANYPLRVDQAQGLLNMLDALIDFGDRRSAALEQTEAFRRIQGMRG